MAFKMKGFGFPYKSKNHLAAVKKIEEEDIIDPTYNQPKEGFDYGDWEVDPDNPYQETKRGTKFIPGGDSSKKDPNRPKMSKEEYAKLIQTEGYKKRKKEEPGVTEEDLLTRPISQKLETIKPTLEPQMGEISKAKDIEVKPTEKPKPSIKLISKYKRSQLAKMFKRGPKKQKLKIWKSGSKFCYQDDNGNQICV